MAGGPLGALAGFALGAFFDNSNVAASNTDMYGQTEGSNKQKPWKGGSEYVGYINRF